jgi:hypothetical protein
MNHTRGRRKSLMTRRTIIAAFLLAVIAGHSGAMAGSQSEAVPRGIFVQAGHPIPADKALKLLFVDARESQGAIPEHFGVNTGPFPWEEGGVFLTEQYRDIGVTIVRTHDFLGPTDWHTIFPDWEDDPDRPSSYDFFESDERILPIVDAGAEVMFRLGVSVFSPEWAREIPDPQKFARIARGIVRHYNAKWDGGYELGIRRWEFWNEPNWEHFWIGTPQEFFAAYEATARQLKSLDPALEVGGPGLAVPFDESNPYFTDFLEYCSVNDVPLDFFSWHYYEGFGEHRPSRFGELAGIIRAALDAYGFHDTESICDEYNSDLLPGGDIFGTVEQAAFVAIANIFLIDNGVTQTFFYRGTQWSNQPNVGLFGASGGYFPVSYAFKALSSMRATPERVPASGTEDFYGILAGISREDQILQVVIADQASSYDSYALLVSGLEGVSEITLEGYLLDADHDLEQVVLAQVPVRNGNARIRAPMTPPSLHLLKITPSAGFLSGSSATPAHAGVRNLIETGFPLSRE